MNADEIVIELEKWADVLRYNHKGFNPEWQAMLSAVDLIKSLQSQLAESQRREQAAVKCIDDIETYLELGSGKFAYNTIKKWRGTKDAGGRKV
jgi:hypothetical protein